MSKRDPLRVVHLPLFARGREVRNSFGVVVATATDPEIAQALAELANLGGARVKSVTTPTAKERALARLAATAGAADDLLKPR